MGLWFFHKKSHKRSRSGANLSEPELVQQRSQNFDTTQQKPKPKRQRTTREPNKLRRRNRTYSFSPGRHDSIRVASPPTRDTAPQIPPQGPLHHYPYNTNTHRIYRHSHSHSSSKSRTESRNGGSREWNRIPTLRHRPPSSQMNRTKSSKRRRVVDRQREAEIKAMTATFAPVRPSAEHWTAGRPMKRDSRRVRASAAFFSPSSDISLPSAASMHSSFSTDSDHAAYKVSALNSLTPRPTLRYASITQPLNGTAGSSPFPRSKSQRTVRLSDRPPIPDATMRAHKRVDDIADDLDASDIRELMERDNRRRERRKQKEQERMERRLTRRAQLELDHQLLQQKRPRHPLEISSDVNDDSKGSRPNLERGVLGRELEGPGFSQPPSAVMTSSRARPQHSGGGEDASSFTRRGPAYQADAHAPSTRESTSSSQPRPFDHFHRPDSAILDQMNILPTPPRGSDEKPHVEHRDAIPTAQDIAAAAAIAAAVGGSSSVARRKSSINRRKSDRRVLKKTRSKSPPLSHPYAAGGTSSETPTPTQMPPTMPVAPPTAIAAAQRVDDSSTTHRSSETGGSGRASRLSWSAIFKWPGRNKRNSNNGSASFNTSRDSMQGVQNNGVSSATPSFMPSSMPIAPNITFIPPPAAGQPQIPRRTVSRFREDLPERPISSPRSRFQSPEVESSRSALIPIPSADISEEPTPTQDIPFPKTSDADRASPTSMHYSSVDPSPEPQSVSMASIDSEGSWFGGGASTSRRRTQIGSLSMIETVEQPQQRAASPSDDDMEEEYFTHLGPATAAAKPLHISTDSAPQDSEGGPADSNQTTWGSLPRTPTLVHHQPAHKIKSSEGLLNTFQEGDEADVELVEDKETRVSDDGKHLPATDSEFDESADEVNQEAVDVQRATSVKLGRNHVRHISAGSAKLLELSPRASVDSRRKSVEPPASITQ